MEKFRIEKNKSITYMLPIFAQFVPIQYYKLIANTYLWYTDIQEETFCILYKFSGKVWGKMGNREGFTIYETKLKQSPYYVDSIDYDAYVVFVFMLPEEMLDHRNKFILGQYSKFEEDNKQFILQFILRYFGPNEKNHIAKILYLDGDMREELSERLDVELDESAELSSAPYVKKELFSTAFVKEEELNE